MTPEVVKFDSTKTCPCGLLGKTYGDCCEHKGEHAYGNAIQRGTVLVMPKGARTPIQSSWVNGNTRFRIVWNVLWNSPQERTFHEFLDTLVKATLGPEWLGQQKVLPADKQHVVFRWRTAMLSLMTQGVGTEDGVHLQRTRTGPAEAYLCFGYDLFWLQIHHKLPDRLVERLRERKTFQSARYEILIAAIFARAGFNIEWLDDGAESGKHCEFIAVHKERGTRVAVEAKSRLRSGSYHFSGPISVELKGDIFDLYDKAVKQRPSDGTPYLIFIDTNLNDRIPPGVPGYAHMPVDSIPWMGQLARELAGWRNSSKTAESGLFITNYSFHYGNNQDNPPVGVCAYFPSPNPRVPLTDTQTLGDLEYCLKYYTEIPHQL